MSRRGRPREIENNLLPENEKLIKDFARSLTGAREKTIENYCIMLETFARIVNRPLDTLKKEDILEFIEHYRNRKGRVGEKIKPRSLKLMIISIKKFYRWLYIRNGGKLKKKEYPPIVADLEVPRVDEREKKLYPSAEEFLRILNACTFIRDKAAIATGYETGTAGRPRKELLNMKIKDVRIVNNVACITIWESKTISRVTVVKKFINELREWLQVHPDANNPNAWLWVKGKGKTPTEKLTYAALNAAFKKACKRAGTPIYPLKSLRHRRAKDLEKVLSIREKMAYFGWKSIATAQIYGSFTSEEACESVIAAEEGREVVRQEEELMKMWKCPSCRTENPPHAKFCMTCSQPQEDATAIRGAGTLFSDLEAITELIFARVLEMLKDDEIGEKVKQILLK